MRPIVAAGFGYNSGVTVVDVLVVGQGLAGTALAWQLRRRGASLLVVDREAADSASRVAAGLLTPVTGRRLAPTPDFAQRLSVAAALYQWVEAETGERFFHRPGAVRLFADAAERARFAEKIGPPDDPLANGFHAPHGGFAMPTAARLHAEAYLAASRRHLAAHGQYRAAVVDPDRDLEVTRAGVRVPALDLIAGRVVFCIGAAPVSWLPAVRPDAGELLTVRVAGLTEARTVHRGVWLAPLGDGRFRAGATYARGHADAAPTTAGRAEILAGLAAFVRGPVEVLDHRGGLRPVAAGHAPVAAVHPATPRVWGFTGLASKGALTAPAVAGELAGRLG